MGDNLKTTAVSMRRIHHRNDESTQSRKAAQIARTRRQIEDALITLAAEGGYCALTVAELCRTAGVGRPTFYRHFSSKRDVLSAIVDRSFADLLAALDALPREEVSISAINLATLRVWKKHRSLFLLARFHEMRDDLFNEFDRLVAELARIYPAYQKIDPFVFQFRHWGMKGVLLQWVDEGMKASPEKINQLIVSHWK